MTNSSTKLMGALLLSSLTSAAYSQDFKWFDTVEITPTDPGGIAAVTLGGTWIDTCIPDAVSHRIDGRQIELNVTQPGLNTGCGDALTDWSLTEEIGPLEAGAYVVTGSLIAVDPSNRNHRQRLFGPDRIGRIEPRRAQFQGLGTGDVYHSRAFDVSADGRVVVGTNGLAPGNAAFITSQAFAWTPETGQIDLGLLPGGIPGGSSARGVSADGNTVVGSSTSSLGASEAFRWTLGGGIDGIGGFGRVPHSSAQAASADGRILVGSDAVSITSAAPFRHRNAFRWSPENGFENLGHLSDLNFTEAFDTAGDGNAIVGSSRVNTPHGIARAAFLWEPEDGIRDLGVLRPAVNDPIGWAEVSYESVANAVSASGEVVVGFSGEVVRADFFGGTTIRQAFRWTEETGMVALPEPTSINARHIAMEAVDVSRRGSLIVGMATITPAGTLEDDTTLQEQREPFIWDEQRGTRLLSEILQLDAGLDDRISSWDLGEVTAISDDGSTIVGFGINPDGQTEAWRAVLSHQFLAGDADFSGFVDFADFLALAGNFGHDGAQFWSTGDFTADGQVAFDDFLALAQNFAPEPRGQAINPVPESAALPMSLAGLAWIGVLRRRR